MANQPLGEDSPEFRWISRTIRTVEKRLGRRSGWNGSIEQDLAWSDRDRMDAGTMIVRDDTVLDPLRRVAQPQGRSTEQLEAAARAIAAVARETAVAIAAAPGVGSEQERALLVGTAEMWGHTTRDDLITDIGLAEAVPELADHEVTWYQYHYHATGAAQGLLRGLAERTKQPYADIADRILTTPAAERWPAIADVAVDLRVDGDDRKAACAVLAADGQATYAAVMDVIAAPTTPQQKADDGVALGDRVAAHLVEGSDDLVPTTADYRWAARVVGAVQDRTGLPSRWNGRLYPTTDPELAGAVYPDDTMTLSDQHVFAPVRTAYSKQDRLTEAEAKAAVHAVHYVAHESAHASGPHPQVVDGQLDPIDVALEEGLVEVWSLRNRSSIVQDIDLDRDVPATGPHAAMNMLCYAAYGNAAIGLVDDLALLTGRPADEITLTLLAADPAERWGLIADLALESQLPDLPADRHQAVRSELAAALRKDYEPVVALQAEAKSPSRPLTEIQDEAHNTGRLAIARLADRIGAVQSRDDPGAEVSPEIRRLRSIVHVHDTQGPGPGTGTGTAAVARPATGPFRTTTRGRTDTSPSRD